MFDDRGGYTPEELVQMQWSVYGPDSQDSVRCHRGCLLVKPMDTIGIFPQFMPIWLMIIYDYDWRKSIHS